MAENNYDLEYTGSMVDRILDTGYDLQNQGYIFRGLASHYTGTPTERTWLIAPTGSTGFGLSSPVPPGSIGICMYNGSSWYAEILNTLTLDSAPTTGSGNGITSGAVKTLAESITNAIGQLEQSVSDRFTSMELEDTTGSLQAEVLSITLKYVFEGEEETLTSLSILAATAEKAGLMSAADKQKLDAFVTNIRSLRIQDTTAQADQGTEITNTLKWTIGGVTEAITAFTLYAATTSKAGLMSAADKTALDTLPSLINAGYLYAGIATPSTVPSSTDAKIFYIAIEGGTYTNFGNLNVTQGINIIYKSGNAWSVVQAVGIDDEPTAGSENLVNSGGVANALSYVKEMSEETSLVGKYIYGNDSGSIGQGSSQFSVKLYDVTGIAKINIKRESLPETGTAKLYAFYDTDDVSELGTETVVGVSSQSISDGALDIDAAVPQGAVTLAVTTYSTFIPSLTTVKMADMEYVYEKLDDYASKKEDIDTMLDSFYFNKYPVKTPSEIVNGKWIASHDGEVLSNNLYDLLVYNVSEGDKVRIDRNILSPIGAAYVYNIYTTRTSSEWSRSTALVRNTPLITAGDLLIEIEVPAAGVCVVLSQLSSSNYTPQLEDIVQEHLSPEYVQDEIDAEVGELDERITQLEDKAGKSTCAELLSDGETLRISYLEGTQEYLYEFKKCLANNLYTFSRIGVRTTERGYADTDMTGVTTINNGYGSDNIGPLAFRDGGFVGGNHVWHNDYTLNVKTAKTDSYTILVDNKTIAAGEKRFCENVRISVVNTLYDPSETPVEGQEILTNPASTETVVYVIEGNSIMVSVNEHIITSNIPNLYYGMQSMFVDETYVMTPRGLYADWASSENGMEFNKGDYPLFNRFIEKSSNAHQASWLIPNKAGDHHILKNSDIIFSRSANKCYHRIVSNYDYTEPVPGLSITWTGVYSFFKTAIMDDSNAFIYKATYLGKDCIFVNSKQQCEFDIPLPSYAGRSINVIEHDDTISTDNIFVDADGVSVTATGTGSLIFVIE